MRNTHVFFIEIYVKRKFTDLKIYVTLIHITSISCSKIC